MTDITAQQAGAPADILAEVENGVAVVAQKAVAGLSAFWKKVVTLWNGDVAPALSIAEHEVLAILKPLFGQVEADALQVAIAFIKGIVAAAPTTKGVSEWEIVIIQLAEVAGGSLWTTIKGLAGNALQALIALVLADLANAAAAQSAAKAA